MHTPHRHTSHRWNDDANTITHVKKPWTVCDWKMLWQATTIIKWDKLFHCMATLTLHCISLYPEHRTQQLINCKSIVSHCDKPLSVNEQSTINNKNVADSSKRDIIIGTETEHRLLCQFYIVTRISFRLIENNPLCYHSRPNESLKTETETISWWFSFTLRVFTTSQCSSLWQLQVFVVQKLHKHIAKTTTARF